jgi:hypothetical protein
MGMGRGLDGARRHCAHFTPHVWCEWYGAWAGVRVVDMRTLYPSCLVRMERGLELVL